MFKILIKAPTLREDVISSFPFLHKLVESYADREVQFNIICEPGHSGIFQFLSLPLEVFEIEEDRNVFSIHKFANKTVDVFNIDLFLT